MTQPRPADPTQRCHIVDIRNQGVPREITCRDCDFAATAADAAEARATADAHVLDTHPTGSERCDVKYCPACRIMKAGGSEAIFRKEVSILAGRIVGLRDKMTDEHRELLHRVIDGTESGVQRRRWFV